MDREFGVSVRFYRLSEALQPYFTALYADRAVSQACVDCHNQHPESPRGDFKLGEVMGGVVVTMKVD